MQTEVMKIDPIKAQQFLDSANYENRRLRGWWVQSLANAMRRGEWILTHQGISFDTTGRLIDGQHRLAAIVEYGKPIEMAVSKGVDPDAFKVVDSGIKRTISDQTHLHKKTAEACRLAGYMVFAGRLSVTADQCLEIYNSGFGPLHDELIEFCSATAQVFSSASVRLCAVIAMMDGISKEYVKTIYSNMVARKYSDLPAVAQVFVRQVDSRKIVIVNKSEILVRAEKVFNPDYADHTRLRGSEADVEATYAYIRSVLRSSLGVSDE